MKIKHSDIEISEGDPFANCKLGRKKHAETLTQIVRSYSEGFVLAINNEWGTGKTTFVKMWEQHLANEQFKTLYFNAWENDFDANPLIQLMSELKTLTNKTNSEAYKELLKKGAVLAKNIVPALVKAFADKYIESKKVTEFLENSANAVTEIFETEINQYAAKKQGLLEFRAELAEYINDNNNGHPVVFFIDELDRCRPSYSVEVLEQLKHFFSVKGIVYVLSIDKTQLHNSINGYYGSEKIDSENYLKRFIDLEYNIPLPEKNLFSNYLYEYYDFNSFFYSEVRKTINVFHSDSKNFLDVADLLFANSKMSLRRQEKIFGLLRLILSTFQPNAYVFPGLLFFVVFIREADPFIFQQISDKKTPPQEILNLISKFFPRTDNANVQSVLLRLEVEFIYRYANDFEHRGGTKLIQTDKTTGALFTKLRSTLHIESGEAKFLNTLERFSNEHNANDFGLDYLLKKISLTDNITL